MAYNYGYNEDTRVKSIVAEYLKEHMDELRHEILNLEGYVSKQEVAAKEQELQERNRKLSDSLAEAKNKLEQARDTFIEQKSTIDSLKRNESDLKEQLRNTEKKLKEAVANRYYEDVYKDIDGLYKSYLELSATLKSSLSGILGRPDNAIAFLCSVSQKKNLEEMWDFACYELNNQRGSKEERQILVELFKFNLYAANQGQECKYALIIPEQGDRYDSRSMQRSSSSKQQGSVKKVLLPGCKNVVSGKIIKPALVDLSDK